MATNAKEFGMIAKTLFGFEDILADELRTLGAREIKKGNRLVSFIGDKALMYRVNYYSRLSLKVLKPLLEFDARTDEELHRKCMDFDWSSLMRINQTFAIDPVVNSPVFTHSHYAGLKVKDAIADRFRKDMGKRPNVDTERPHFKINVHISNTRVNISLDSSGDSLHKRGYRKKHGVASLNEVLAAGLITLSEWDKKSEFFDPMCGSGTLLTEAALMAWNIAPGSFHRDYLFTNWSDYEPELMKKVVDERPPTPERDVLIHGSDISFSQVNAAKLNIRNTGLGDRVTVEKRPFEKTSRQTGKGCIIMNPPYGERLQMEDLEELYSTLGDHLKREYNGYDATVFSAKQELLKHVGLHPGRKLELYNGEFKSFMYVYELYEGSRKS